MMSSIQTISKVIATIIVTPINISYAQDFDRGEYSDIFSSNTNYNYKGNTNCRTTTSKQTLSCLGLRCKPQHDGGCTQSEYTAESIQTSCTNPGAGTGSETAAKICYYDTICCPIDINDGTPSLNSLTIMETTKNNNENTQNNEWPDEPQMYTSSAYTSLSTTPQSEDGGSIGAGLGFAIMFMIGAVLYIIVARIKKRREQNNKKSSVTSSSSRGFNGFLEDGNNVEVPPKKKKSQRTIYEIDSSSSSSNSHSRRSDPPSLSGSSRNSGSRNSSRGGGSRTNQSRKSGTSRHSKRSRQSKNTVDRYLEKQAKDMEALGISSRSGEENSILS